MQKTAVGLAELHKSKVEIGRMVTWEEEIEQVQGQVKQLSAVFPQLLPAAETLLRKAEKARSGDTTRPNGSITRYIPAFTGSAL